MFISTKELLTSNKKVLSALELEKLSISELLALVQEKGLIVDSNFTNAKLIKMLLDFENA